ncbi:drug:h+ antiporter [Marasmius fiardii PR-910]|nr:drug:h+ antiporter [Marasmius fiardii PR-910]
MSAIPRASSSSFIASSADPAKVDTGIKTVEATHKVYGKYSKWFLFVGLGLASYIYSLESQTTYSYLAFATSAFNDHSLIATIQVAQAVIIATFKPVIARLADITSRGVAYIVVLICYVVGYIVIASAKRVEAVAGGIVVYAIGYTGLQLLTQIIIADITVLKWRGLVSGLTSLPFVINAFIGANVSTSILTHSGWRWGYGMFAILVPAALAPLIVTLLWAERKAKKLDLAPKIPKTSLFELVRLMDTFGLMLLGAGVALILLPLTLARSAENGWNNPSMIAMIVVGFVILFGFVVWERWVEYPVIPGKFMKNRSVMLAAFIGFFDFVSFYLTFTYLYSFILVVKPWPLLDATYFVNTQSVALTVFGIMGGIIMRFAHRYKWTLVTGLAIRLFGVGLMIHSRGAQGSTAEVVWTQIIQGMGGGIAAITSQVGAQASVTHVDVAMVTAIVLLFAEVGGAVGNAISGAIWTNEMPSRLAVHLPNLNETERSQIFASISLIRDQYLEGSETRIGIVAAYSDVMRSLLIAATCIAVVPLLISLAMPEWHLGDTQNAVDHVDLDGSVDSSMEESDEKRDNDEVKV